MKNRAWKNKVATSALAAVIGLCTVPTAALSQTESSAKETASTQDIIIFKNGRTLEGKIVSETASAIRFKGLIAGIEAETEYPMSDILTIKRGVAKTTGDAPAAPSNTAAPTLKSSGGSDKAAESRDGKTGIYWVELKGEFGQEISETPIRNAIRDAKRNNAEVIVFELDADWNDKDGVINADKANDQDSDFQGIFRAEKILPVLVNELPTEYNHKPPRIVFWVKQAMAGAAFVPLCAPEIYFSSEARMGGIGNLSQLYGNTGDEVVREKLRSAFLRHAEGWAIKGGYNPMIIRAMGRSEFVMSYRVRDGKVELFEGYPQAPGEVLLTDDGMGGNFDSLSERVRWTGNDVLTMNAETAKLVGLSRGTVDTRDELLHAMGLERTGVLIPGRAKQIQKEWVDGVANAKKRIVTLFEEYQEIQVQGDYQERTRARGLQIRKLEEIKALMQKWGEGLEQWLGENGIPPVSEIMIGIDQIKLRQLADKR
ncbi:MAG TPA: hypothetical protein VD997_02865 [Phycisphaerales bacterium]|nr:hypothetical protein [Phycisphaerales bacterium]